MIYLAINKTGEELMFNKKPININGFWTLKSYVFNNCIKLPKNTIKTLKENNVSNEFIFL